MTRFGRGRSRDCADGRRIGGDAGRRAVWTAPPVFPSGADLLLPPRDRDLTLAWRVLGAVVVVACCALVLWVLHPSLLLRDTTPNGGDLGAHVWFPAFLRDHLLPDWRVAGWSNDWFGGFPAGQFYFPVPALVTVRPRHRSCRTTSR